MVTSARIIGTGMCVPDRVVTNDDLAKVMNTSDEWITQRTGIKERRFAEDGTNPSDLALEACEMALKRARTEINDIDLAIVATLSPEHFFPGTAAILQAKLGMGTTPVLDLRAQCSGFIYSLQVAQAMIEAGKYRRILVCGVELQSNALELNDRGRDMAVLFGDGAGAVVVEASDKAETGILDVQIHTQGEHYKKLWLEYPASGKNPHISAELIEEGRVFPNMDGRFVFKNAVTRLPEVVSSLCKKHHLGVADIDLFLFHQANLRINEHVGQMMGIREDQVFNNIHKYGNCSSASLPLCLHEAHEAGMIKPGSLICMAAFGAGFTWGSALIRW